MKVCRVEFLPIPVQEAARQEELYGTKVKAVYTWGGLHVEDYYEAMIKVLEALKQTSFGKEFKKTYRKDLGISHVKKYLRVSVEEDKRFNKPDKDYIVPLVEELKKLGGKNASV